MTAKITIGHFSGISKVHGRDADALAAAVRGLAQAHARRVVASLSDVTDSGGGTNNAGGLVKPAAFVAFQAGTGDGVAKAEFETACGGIRDALKELLAQCNTIAAKVPAFDALTDNMGGTAADGTIGAIDVSMTGTDATAATMVAVAGAQTVFDTLLSRTAQLLVFVNKLRVACGMSEIASEDLGDIVYSDIFAAVSTSTGTATGGSDATTDATLAKAAVDPALVIMANNVKTLSTALNAMTADANANAALAVVAA